MWLHVNTYSRLETTVVQVLHCTLGINGTRRGGTDYVGVGVGVGGGSEALSVLSRLLTLYAPQEMWKHFWTFEVNAYI